MSYLSRALVQAVACLATAACGNSDLPQTDSAASSAVLAPAAELGFITLNGCVEHQVFVDGDGAAIAARLPKEYKPVTNLVTGAPLLFIRAESCKLIAVGDQGSEAILANFSVLIDSPDGQGCTSGFPLIGAQFGSEPPVCNRYSLFWLSNDQRIVNWLQQTTPDLVAVYVPNIVFQLGALDPLSGGAPFHFEAPSPSPSPFVLDAVAREHPGAPPIRGGYWTNTAEGVVKLVYSTEAVSTGDATGTVTAEHGSEMASLLGADSRSYAEPYAQFTAERFAHASYRKQLIDPPFPGEPLNTFAGSCSITGTNNFNPALSDASGALSFTFDATGTCSGTLNGQPVSNAPVTLHDSGQAEGTCAMVSSTVPSPGTMTFSDGTTIGYSIDFMFVATQGYVNYYGDRSGSAHGSSSFVTTSTPPTLAVQCAAGGVSQAPFTLSLISDAYPLVSHAN